MKSVNCPRCGATIGTTGSDLELLARAESAEAREAELRAVTAAVREWATLTVHTKAADEVFATIDRALAPDSVESKDGSALAAVIDRQIAEIERLRALLKKQCLDNAKAGAANAELRAVIARIANDGCGLAHRTEAGGKWLTCDESAESDDDRCWSCIARRALTPDSAEGDEPARAPRVVDAARLLWDDSAEPTSEGDE